MVNNIIEKFSEVTELWSPKIVAEINDQYVKIAKIKGEFVWHNHAQEDEFFYVVKGEMKILLKDKEIVLKENEFYVVPKTVEHCPSAEEECWIMLVEKKETQHTGEVVTDKTKSIDEQLY
ncbi:MAG: cupin domain-containing protein [Rhodothermaceae bacterium]